MKWCNDATGRFTQRPYYLEEELDHLCETIIVQHLERYCGEVVLPVPTNALTTLIECDADDLDVYADLTAEGPDVEGMTEFIRGKLPRVKIASTLTTNSQREHRLRTTLAHEYGHVHFHAPLFERREPTSGLFLDTETTNRQVCQRRTILRAKQSDWMEWQAGFCCGALLMPATGTRRAVVDYLDATGMPCPVYESSTEGAHLTARIAEMFNVSSEAAQIRLSRLGYLVRHGLTPTLVR
ncbi:MAG TPA: ImmA/IrrE family metallo-endopeptidase [Armatimonadota bacterium]